MFTKVVSFINDNYRTVLATLSPAPVWVRAFFITSVLVSTVTIILVGSMLYAIAYKQLRSFGPVSFIEGGLVFDKEAARKSLLTEKFKYRMTSATYIYGSADNDFCAKTFVGTLQPAALAKYQTDVSIDAMQRAAEYNFADGSSFYNVKCSTDSAIATITLASYIVAGDNVLGSLIDQSIRNLAERTQPFAIPRNLKNITYVVRFDQFSANGRRLSCPDAVKSIFDNEPGYIYVDAQTVPGQVVGHVYRITNDRSDETYLSFRCVNQFDVVHIYGSLMGSNANASQHADRSFKRLIAAVQAVLPRPFYTSAAIDPHVHVRKTAYKALTDCNSAIDKVLKGAETRTYNKRLVAGPRFNVIVECSELEPANVTLVFGYGYFSSAAPGEPEMEQYERELLAQLDDKR